MSFQENNIKDESLRYNRFSLKKFIYGINGYIGLIGLKFKITINQIRLLHFVTI